MVHVSIASHPAEPFDLQDLIDAPDDGYRYEVVDGALVVNAAPSWRHQRVVARLTRLLEDAARGALVVLPAPVWRLAPGQVPEPDLVVCHRDALGAHAVEGVPELVVEVLSPSNRGADLVRKRALYAEGGCPYYWIVDPDEPSVTVLVLSGDGVYEESVHAAGDERVETELPLRMAFRPAELVTD